MALYIIGGIILLLILLLFLRVGVEIVWGEQRQTWVRVGFIRKQLAKKQSSPPKKEKEKEKPAKTAAGQSPSKKKWKPTFADIRTLFPAAGEALQKGLRKTRHRVKIDPMDVSVTFGGNDPADIAETYGFANAAMWTVMPEVEKLTRMPRPHIHLGMDYDQPKTVVTGKVGVSIQIRDIFAIAFAFGLPLWRWYRKSSAMQKSPGKEKNPTGDPTQKEQSKTA